VPFRELIFRDIRIEGSVIISKEMTEGDVAGCGGAGDQGADE